MLIEWFNWTHQLNLYLMPARTTFSVRLRVLRAVEQGEQITRTDHGAVYLCCPFIWKYF